MAYVNLVCKTHNSTDDGEELKPQDSCLVDIFLFNILLFTLEKWHDMQLISIIVHYWFYRNPFLSIY